MFIIKKTYLKVTVHGYSMILGYSATQHTLASCYEIEASMIKGTVKLYFNFSEKDTFITNKKRDVSIFLKFDP